MQLAKFMSEIKTAQNYDDIIRAAEKEPEQEALAKALARIYIRVGTDFAKITVRDLKQKKAAPPPIETDFWEATFEQYAKTQLGQKIVWISNTTKELYISIVQRVIQTAGKTGLSIWDTAKEIQKQIGYSNHYRAERIARTEIIKASNLGTLEAGKNASIPTLKEWLPIVDEWSRPDHAAMDGQPPIAMDQQFNVGGTMMNYPGDESAGPEHVINCRCALNIVPAPEAETPEHEEINL